MKGPYTVQKRLGIDGINQPCIYIEIHCNDGDGGYLHRFTARNAEQLLVAQKRAEEWIDRALTLEALLELPHG